MGKKEILTALFVVLLWSTNLIVQKIAVGHLSIFVLSFLRAFAVLPFLLLYPKPEKSLRKYFLCGFFLIVLYLILFNLGLQTDIGAGISSFIVQMQVFFIILCCYFILGEKPTWYQIVGILLSVAGISLLKITSTTSFPLLGILLLIASCFSYGIGIALSKKYKVGNTMNDVTWLSASSSIPLFFVCLLFEGPGHTFELIYQIDLTGILCILFATIASTVWGTYLWLKLLQEAPTSSVVPFMLLMPIFSNLISYVFLGESLTALQVASGIIIIFGVTFAQGIHRSIPSIIKAMTAKLSNRYS